MSTGRRIAGQTALLTGGNLIGLGLNFAGGIVITRALGPEGRGTFAWLLTLVGIAIQVAALAPAPAIRALPDEERARLPLAIPLLAGLGTVLTMPLLAYGLARPAPAVEVDGLLLLGWIAVPATAAALGLSTLVQIGGKPGPILAVQSVPRLVQLGLVLLFAALGRMDVAVAIGLFATTACVEVGLAAALLPRGTCWTWPDGALLRAVAGRLGAGWVATIALFCLSRVGLLVLAGTAPLAETGIYSVALTLQEVALIAPVALGGVLISLGGGRRAGRRAATLILGGVAVACAAAALLAPFVVPLLFGARFAGAADLFRLLLPGVVCAAAHQIAQSGLYASGSARVVAAPALAGFAVAILTALLAVPAYGAEGAVLSNLCGYLTLAVLSVRLSVRS